MQNSWLVVATLVALLVWLNQTVLLETFTGRRSRKVGTVPINPVHHHAIIDPVYHPRNSYGSNSHALMPAPHSLGLHGLRNRAL